MQASDLNCRLHLLHFINMKTKSTTHYSTYCSVLKKSSLLCSLQLALSLFPGFQKLIYDEVKPFPTRIVTSKVIELLRVLVGSPPDVSILSKICDFLVAIHPPASMYLKVSCLLFHLHYHFLIFCRYFCLPFSCQFLL